MRERLFRGDVFEHERSRREDFDPIAEGKRYGLAPEVSAALWEHVGREATNSDGVSDENAARARFAQLAELIARRGGKLGTEPFRWTQVDVALGRLPPDDPLAKRVPGRTALVLAEASPRARVALGGVPGRTTLVAHHATAEVGSLDESRGLFRRYVNGGHAGRAKLERAIAARDHYASVIATSALKQDLASARRHLSNGLERDEGLSAEFAAFEGPAEQLLAKLPNMSAGGRPWEFWGPSSAEWRAAIGDDAELITATANPVRSIAGTALWGGPLPGVSMTNGHALWQVAEHHATTLHRRAVNSGAVDQHDPAVESALQQRGTGQPLPEELRLEMEPELGVSLAGVRVHTDAVAARAARALSAEAFVIGEDIFFAEGMFVPDTRSGKKLLVHELTHVAQALRGDTGPTGDGLRLSQPGDPLEREADDVAARVDDTAARPTPAAQDSGGRRADMPVQRGATSEVIQRQPTPQQAKPEIKLRSLLDFPLETNGQVAAFARVAIASVQHDLGDVESAAVKTRAAEWITTVKGAIPYYDRHADEKVDPSHIPLINYQYDELLQVRAAMQQDTLIRIKEALWREHEAAVKTAEEAETLQPALDDALRAAYRKGSSSTVKEVVSTVKGALSVGSNLRTLAANIITDIMGLPIASGTKVFVDHWTSQIGTPKITIINVGKYTEKLRKLGRGLSALNIALTIADRSKKATEAEQGMKDLSDAVSIGTDLISVSPLSAPPHFSLYSTLYLKPALKVIAKQIGMLVENLSDVNRVAVEATGDLMYPNAEPGGQEMFDLMVQVMHAEDESGFPVLTSGVQKYLFDHREKLSTGAESDVPTEGRFSKHLDAPAGRRWLFANRWRVWAMFYGSMKVPD